ncbi:MAG: tail fiber domain-containing protein [Acidobacteria bacterium]|nr:tail fiber domain-containing protein [Acidobacteriota bacterium]
MTEAGKVGIGGLADTTNFVDVRGSISITSPPYDASLLRIRGTLVAQSQAYLQGIYVNPTYNLSGGYANYIRGILVDPPSITGANVAHVSVGVEALQPTNGYSCSAAFAIGMPNQSGNCPVGSGRRYGIYQGDPNAQYNFFASNVGLGTGTPGNILTVVAGSATDPIADAWTIYSSRRWKTNIQTIDGALDKVMRLRGVTYEWKSDGKRDIGLIAEEVGEVIPEVVVYEENGKDAKSVDYSRLVALLIEAVKEQQEQIQEQALQLAELRSEIIRVRQDLRPESARVPVTALRVGNERFGFLVRLARPQLRNHGWFETE